jgi:HK97 family phage portal protein
VTTLPDIGAKGASAAPYLNGSVFYEGAGTKGQKPRPFSLHAAVRQFSSWAAAAIMLNANAAAGVPLRMYTRKRPGARKMYATRAVDGRTKRYLAGQMASGAGRPSAAVMAKVASFGHDVEEVTDPHPLMALLNAPNPDDTSHDQSLAKFIDRQLCGNAYWYLATSRLGVPGLIYRMPAQWTAIVPNDKGTGQSRIRGYVYGKNTANEQSFGPDEVIHFKEPNPADLFYGRGWVEQAWTALGLHNAKRIEDTAFKDNQSRPDGVLSSEGGSKDTVERLQSAIVEQFGGTLNTGKMLVTNGKLSWTPLQWEPRELGTPDRIVNEIAASSGVPVSMLLTNDTTKAGGVAARLGWYRTTIRPMCLADEQTLNAKLVPRFDGSDDYFVAHDHVCFEDEEASTKRAVALVSGGILTQNEARQELGYNSVDDADRLFAPAGNTGGSASAMGDLSPQQNDERPDRN